MTLTPAAFRSMLPSKRTEIEVGGADGVTVFPLPAMTPAERIAVERAIEFKIAKLRSGLGMPPDPEALAGYELLLRQVRASA